MRRHVGGCCNVGNRKVFRNAFEEASLGACTKVKLWIGVRLFADTSFALAKKEGDGVDPTKQGKGSKWMVVVYGQGIPVACQLTSASPVEVKLMELTLDRAQTKLPFGLKLICDRGYYGDPLR